MLGRVEPRSKARYLSIMNGLVAAGAQGVIAGCTEIGTLELWCVAKDGNNRWRLEFNVRDIIKEPAEDERQLDQVTDVWPEEYVQEAAKLVRACARRRARLRSSVTR